MDVSQAPISSEAPGPLTPRGQRLTMVPMLVPQFTIRWLLALTAVLAGVFSIVALAIRGRGWAQGISAGFVALVAAMVVYAALFALVWLAGEVLARLRKPPAGGSPFRQPEGAPGAPVGQGLAPSPSSGNEKPGFLEERT